MGLRPVLDHRRPMAEAGVRFQDIRSHQEGLDISWQLLKERPECANITHKAMPTREEHMAFVAAHPYRQWYVIESDVVRDPRPHRVPVGTIYASHQNEIGIAILREHQRHGWASRAIQELIEFLPPLPGIPGARSGWWLANVSPYNQPSLDLFWRKLGCHKLQVTFQLPERGAGHGKS